MIPQSASGVIDVYIEASGPDRHATDPEPKIKLSADVVVGASVNTTPPPIGSAVLADACARLGEDAWTSERIGDTIAVHGPSGTLYGYPCTEDLDRSVKEMLQRSAAAPDIAKRAQSMESRLAQALTRAAVLERAFNKPGPTAFGDELISGVIGALMLRLGVDEIVIGDADVTYAVHKVDLERMRTPGGMRLTLVDRGG